MLFEGVFEVADAVNCRPDGAVKRRLTLSKFHVSSLLLLKHCEALNSKRMFSRTNGCSVNKSLRFNDRNLLFNRQDLNVSDRLSVNRTAKGRASRHDVSLSPKVAF